MPNSIQTPFLVLRKTPYNDTSLIVAGITPGHGQLHFLIQGGQRLGRRQFPAADLFRCLEISYRPGHSDLHRWQHAELQENFDSVAGNMAAYQAAGWLAQFALLNIQTNLPHPRTFAACLTALRRLASSPAANEQPHLQASLCVCLGMVFLDEHGLLPDFTESEALTHQRQTLLAVAEGHSPFPQLAPDAWHKLQSWITPLLHDADCRLP